MDEYLQRTADSLGAGDSFDTIPLGNFLGTSGETVPDPYLEGSGPTRTGCIKCGNCLTGCPYNAKNRLDQNYLYMAERLGEEI
jgi:cholesterol oxidase